MASSTTFPVHQVPAPSSAASEKCAVSDQPSSKESGGTESVQVVARPLDDSETNPPIVTKAMHRKRSIQFAVLCIGNFVCGWNSGIVRPLIPQIQETYHLGYSVLSVYLSMTLVGSTFGATTFVHLTDRFGFGVIAVAGPVIAAIGNALQGSAAPFPVFAVGSFLTGVGNAFIVIGSEAFIASQAGDKMANFMMLWAANDAGSMCAPLAASQFARLPRWSLAYIVSTAFNCITAVFAGFAFTLKGQEECLKEIGQPLLQKIDDSKKGVNKYKQVLRLPFIHLVAFFFFALFGLRAVIESWIVTFLVKERHGGTNSGYVSSGFSGGLVIGRLALIPVSKKLGDWRAIFLYILLALGFELVVWLVPSFIVNAVSVSFVGFFLGPIIPLIGNHIRSILAPQLIAKGISWIGGIATVGPVVLVPVPGAIASRTSINNLHPMLIAMMGFMLIIWAFVLGGIAPGPRWTDLTFANMPKPSTSTSKPPSGHSIWSTSHGYEESGAASNDWLASLFNTFAQ